MMSGVEEICRAWNLMERVVIMTQGFNQGPKEETLKRRQEETSWCWPGGVGWEGIVRPPHPAAPGLPHQPRAGTVLVFRSSVEEAQVHK